MCGEVFSDVVSITGFITPVRAALIAESPS